MKTHQINTVVKTFLMSFSCFVIALLSTVILIIVDIQVVNEVKVGITLIIATSSYSFAESLFIVIDDFISEFSAVCG